MSKLIKQAASDSNSYIQINPLDVNSFAKVRPISDHRVSEFLKDFRSRGFLPHFPVSGFIQGNGRVFITDGAHRITAYRRGIQTGVLPISTIPMLVTQNEDLVLAKTESFFCNEASVLSSSMDVMDYVMFIAQLRDSWIEWKINRSILLNGKADEWVLIEVDEAVRNLKWSQIIRWLRNEGHNSNYFDISNLRYKECHSTFFSVVCRMRRYSFQVMDQSVRFELVDSRGWTTLLLAAGYTLSFIEKDTLVLEECVEVNKKQTSKQDLQLKCVNRGLLCVPFLRSPEGNTLQKINSKDYDIEDPDMFERVLLVMSIVKLTTSIRPLNNKENIPGNNKLDSLICFTETSGAQRIGYIINRYIQAWNMLAKIIGNDHGIEDLIAPYISLNERQVCFMALPTRRDGYSSIRARYIFTNSKLLLEKENVCKIALARTDVEDMQLRQLSEMFLTELSNLIQRAYRFFGIDDLHNGIAEYHCVNGVLPLKIKSIAKRFPSLVRFSNISDGKKSEDDTDNLSNGKGEKDHTDPISSGNSIEIHADKISTGNGENKQVDHISSGYGNENDAVQPEEKIEEQTTIVLKLRIKEMNVISKKRKILTSLNSMENKKAKNMCSTHETGPFHISEQGMKDIQKRGEQKEILPKADIGNVITNLEDDYGHNSTEAPEIQTLTKDLEAIGKKQSNKMDETVKKDQSLEDELKKEKSVLMEMKALSDLRFCSLKSSVSTMKASYNETVQLFIVNAPLHSSIKNSGEILEAVVSIFSNCLQEGGYAFVFHSHRDLHHWESVLLGQKSLSVESDLFHVIYDQGEIKSGRDIVHQALVAKKKGVQKRKKMLQGGYVSSTYSANSNVINGVRSIENKAYMKNYFLGVDKKEPVKRQLPLQLLQELIQRYTDTQDIVGSLFENCVSVGSACLSMHEGAVRRFVGILNCPSLHKNGTHYLETIFLKQVASSLYRSDTKYAQKVAQRILKNRKETVFSDQLRLEQCKKWRQPSGLPKCTKIPHHLISYLNDRYRNTYNFSPHEDTEPCEWPVELRSAFLETRTIDLRIADLMFYGGEIKKSRIPNAGSGFFAIRQMSKNEISSWYGGTLVYRDLSEEKDDCKQYGVAGFTCTVKQFKDYAINIKKSLTMNVEELTSHSVFVVPYLFCSGSLLNDAMDLHGGTKIERKINAEFCCSEVFEIDDITNPYLIHLKTTCDIEDNEELLASYGSGYWKYRIQ